MENENNMQQELIREKRKNNKKRQQRKLAWLFTLTGITAVVLIVETYAWFIGTGTIETSSFEIGVSTEESLFLSLNGEDWTTDLTISDKAILGTLTASGDEEVHNAYEGHTNQWVGDAGLVPISTNGQIDTDVSRLMLYGKSSLTATKGGFRLISTRINNYSGPRDLDLMTDLEKGYVAFDLFIKNGEGVDYLKEYNVEDDEAIYLTKSSKVSVSNAGTPEGQVTDYGLANSVRVAFMQVGRVASRTEEVADITGITCNIQKTVGEDGEAGEETVVDENVTGLCRDVIPTIWEPNDTKHNSNLVTYFGRVCKKRTLNEETEEYEYKDTCEAVADGTAVTTYVVNKNIESSDNVDVYDGLNGYNLSIGNELGGESTLYGFPTFTDSMKVKEDDERPAFIKLAANSITKIRVYVYLEGQDVDNYDLVSKDKKISIQFGFTKDQFDLKEQNNTETE